MLVNNNDWKLSPEPYIGSPQTVQNTGRMKLFQGLQHILSSDFDYMPATGKEIFCISLVVSNLKSLSFLMFQVLTTLFG